MASENGTLYKNGIPFLDDDILIVFEDDADIAIKDVRLFKILLLYNIFEYISNIMLSSR